MDDAIPFAAILLVLAFMSWRVWPRQELLAVALGIASVIIIVARAVELAD